MLILLFIVIWLTVWINILWTYYNSLILTYLRIIFSSFWTLVHELGHGLIASPTLIWIIWIRINLSHKTIKETSTLWYCKYITPTNYIHKILSTFWGHFLPLVITLLGAYFYWIWKIYYLFFIFIIFGFIYLIKWERFIDRIQALILLLGFWYLIYIWLNITSWLSLELYQLIWTILLGLLVWGVIESLFFHIWLYETKVEGSDAKKLASLTYVPAIIWILIWTLLSFLTLLLSFSFILNKTNITSIPFIDKEIKIIHDYLNFKEKYKWIKAVNIEELQKELNKEEKVENK